MTLCAALLWLALLALVGASPANASFLTGNDVLRDCTSHAAVTQEYCLGYVMGIADSLDLDLARLKLSEEVPADSVLSACVPAGVQATQVKDVVIKYLRENPTTRNLPGGMLVTIAIKNAWCPAK